MVGKRSLGTALAAITIASVPAWGQMRITEYMYNSLTSGNPEWVEFTNVGTSPVDMTGWSYDDSGRVPGSTDVSAFGIVQPGESVVLCEGDEAAFRTLWNVPGSVDVIGNNVNNLGRADEINLYDNLSNLVDRLTYDDQTLGGPRTQGISAWMCKEYLGLNDVAGLRASSVGDVQGSYMATNNTDVGSPGSHASVQCLCGNGVVDSGFGEECDGSLAANCASGSCNADCSCEAAPVPTVSEWGLAVLTLVGLCAGTIMFGRVGTVRA